MSDLNRTCGSISVRNVGTEPLTYFINSSTSRVNNWLNETSYWFKTIILKLSLLLGLWFNANKISTVRLIIRLIITSTFSSSKRWNRNTCMACIIWNRKEIKTEWENGLNNNSLSNKDVVEIMTCSLLGNRKTELHIKITDWSDFKNRMRISDLRAISNHGHIFQTEKRTYQIIQLWIWWK